MMGSSHALSGAAVWLAGSWALEATGAINPQTPLELAVGTAVCAGGALLPDLDLSGRVTTGRGGATVAHTFGRVTMFLAEVIEKFSLGVYNVTRLRRDPERHNGHRTLTHTIIFNVLVGIGTWQLALHYGKWAVIGIMFFMVGLALRGLFDKWAARAGWVIVTLVSGWAAFFVYNNMHGDRGYPLLGVAVGVGGLVHLAGDVVTSHGCPLFWPVPTGPGRLWRNIGVPDPFVVEVGGKVETVVLRTIFTIVSLVCVAGLSVPFLMDRFNIEW
ncbi:metal-dependent hydrolase [Luedemannella helvata]|uniref:Metal-dependent hydrolase n=1 Tax=Luedemannella helvata TaxID=349315 RepID=A0ABN2JW19_9ACTN